MRLNQHKREMLTYAAKAYGIEIVFEQVEEDDFDVVIRERKRMQTREWNPYESDAQAFQLAVALNLEIKISDDSIEVANSRLVTTCVPGEEKAKLVRECIVFIAADVGKQIESDENAEDQDDDDEED